MERDTIRVTHVVYDLEAGGMETIVAELARRYAGTDVVMSVITLSGRVGRVGRLGTPPVRDFVVLRPLSRWCMLAPTTLARAIRRTRPDVVHLHSGCWYKASRAARMAAAPLVLYTEHGREHHDPPLTRWFAYLAQRRTDVVVPVSGRLARYLAARIGVPPTRIQTIVNGVDTARFVPGPPPPKLWDRLGIPRDARILGSVGRLEPVKAYERLIHALAALRTAETTRPVYLVLCGEGSERHRLEAEAGRLGLADRVRLPGWSHRPEDMYRLFDVFALTSRSEGASLSLMEAMACGTAPVVMDVGANREILGPELHSHVVPDGATGAFIGVVRHVLESEQRLTAARRIARERAVQCYSLDRMAAEYERIYRRTAEHADSRVACRTLQPSSVASGQ